MIDSQIDLESQNKPDVWHTITFKGKQIAFPPFCTCCMAPTSQTEIVSISETDAIPILAFGVVTHKKTIEFRIPLCPECSEHRAQLSKMKMQQAAYSIAAGTLCSTLIILTGMVDGFLGFLAGGAVLAVAYAILGFVFKTGILPYPHTSREESVRIEFNADFEICLQFYFSNGTYASLFKQANSGTTSSISKEQRVDKTRILPLIKANEHPLKLLAITMAIFACIAIAIASILH